LKEKAEINEEALGFNDSSKRKAEGLRRGGP
jgi:hypothetical protein